MLNVKVPGKGRRNRVNTAALIEERAAALGVEGERRRDHRH